MIRNEQELKATQERIEKFQRRLVALRRTARPKEFDAVASGYRLEIERMQAEVMEFTTASRAPVISTFLRDRHEVFGGFAPDSN